MMIVRKTFFTTLVLTASVLFASSAFSVDYINDAKQYLERKEYKSAIIQLKNQLKKEPNNAQARYLLGTAYLKRGQIASAEKESKKAYELDSSSAEITLSYAQLLLLNQKYNKVNEILDIEYTNKKAETQRQLYRADASLGLGQIVDAKQIFNDIVQQKNKNTQAYNGLARIAFLEKEIDAASQWIEKTLSLDAENKVALELKANIAISDKRYSDALAIYSKLTQQNPNDLKLYTERAEIQLMLNNIQAAEEDVNRVLKEIANQPQANFIRAQIKIREQNYREAQIAAQNVLNVFPHHYPSILILGIANLGQGHFNQAEKYIIQYLSSNPDNISAQNLLANVYLGQGMGEQALLILEEIDEEKRASSFEVLNSLGTAYMLVGEHEKGLAALNLAEDINPGSDIIQQKLIIGQIQSGDINNAIIGLEKIVDSKESTRQLNYLLIVFYIQKKELIKAEVKINALLSETPDDITLYNYIAIVERIKGHHDKAEAAYQKILQLDRNYIPAYFSLARLAMDKSDLDKAQSYINEIIRINDQNINAYIALADIAEKQNNPQEIEKQLMTGLKKISETNVEAEVTLTLVLGKWYLKQQQIENVLFLAQNLSKKYPDNKEALSLLVIAEIASKKESSAEQTLEKIINIDDTDSKHRLLLVNLLISQSGRENDVIKLFDELIEISPDNIDSVARKAVYLLKTQQYPQALDVADYAQNHFPDSVFALQLKGDIYLKQKQYEQALENYQQAYILQANNALLSVMAKILVAQGKENEAIKLFEDVLKKDNKNEIVHYKLAIIYQQRNQYNEAIKHYQTLLSINEDNALALNNLAWLYSQQNNPQAIILAKKAHEIVPDSASVADTYGYILLKQTNNIEESINILQQAAKQSPNTSDIQYHLAEAYYLNNEKQKAKAILGVILRADKSFSEKENAEKLLKKIES